MHVRGEAQPVEPVELDAFAGLSQGRRLTQGEAAAHEDLVARLRTIQDLMAGADATPAAYHRLAAQLDMVARELAKVQVNWRDQVAGWQMATPGRGQTFAPPLDITRFDSVGVVATVTFTRFYLGSGGFVHGGAMSLAADEVLGRWSRALLGGRCRTAYLHIDYRRVTPANEPLTLIAHPVEISERKLLIRGELRSTTNLLCDIEALFVLLRPDQP